MTQQRIDDGGPERWETIADGHYEVSSIGRVRRLISRACGKNGFILKQFIRRDYSAVRLSCCGKVANMQVHRLVAIAFLGEPKDGQQVNHKDGDKLNNNVSNLEWVTAQENTAHAASLGLRKYGDQHWTRRREGRCKLSLRDSEIIRKMSADGVPQSRIASVFGVSQSVVSRVKSGRLRRPVQC